MSNYFDHLLEYLLYFIAVYCRSAGDGVVKHYHIKKTDTGHFCISDSHAFDTLPELVVYHKHEAGGQFFVVYLLTSLFIYLPPYLFTSLRIGLFYYQARVFCVYFVMVYFDMDTPCGAGVPPSAFAAPLSIHFLIFCSLLLFPFFLFSFTLLIFLYCPSDPFLPESSHSVSRREVVGLSLIHI